jgi:anti-sigma B factor antagonist
MFSKSVNGKSKFMELTVRLKQTKPGLVTLSLVGKIDADNYVILDREIGRVLTEPVKTLILDMQGVDFITSAGIGTIVKATTTLKRKGGDIAMINLQPQVKTVFEIIRLLPTLNVFESTKELDEYLARVQNKMLGGDEF